MLVIKIYANSFYFNKVPVFALYREKLRIWTIISIVFVEWLLNESNQPIKAFPVAIAYKPWEFFVNTQLYMYMIVFFGVKTET